MKNSLTPARPPQPRRQAAARSLLTVGTAMLVVLSSGPIALAQPTTTPLPTTTETQNSGDVQQQTAAPTQPCVAPTTITSTTPSTTTAPTATTTTNPPPVCETPVEPVPLNTSATPVPPTAPPEPATEPELSPSTATDAAPGTTKIPFTGLPTENPNDTVVPGKMRSDREEIPEGYTKEDADKAEIAEADAIKKRSMQRGASAMAAPTDCMTYWPAWPFQVCGEIRVKYDSLGGSTSFLLLPTANDVANPDNYGRRQTFGNGPIYWSPATGAHPVVNSFLNRWSVHRYEAGWLKYPTTDEILLPDGGRRQEFQGGAIYVAIQNAIGSAIQNGPIRDKWNTVGGGAPGGSLLGYITGDEIPLPDGQGRMARFENGVIYWHPTYGAWIVRGGILHHWEFIGYEGGPLGYPASDEYVEDGAIKQLFENNLLEYGALEPEPDAPLSRDPNWGSPIVFYEGDEKIIPGVGATLSIRRQPSERNSRRLDYGFEINESAILYRAQYGYSTTKDCTSYMYSRSRGVHFKDTNPAHKNMLITRLYHNSVPNHDDDREYAMNISCGFHNRTQNLNGKGTLAYGYFIAYVDRTYIFRIR